MDEMTAKIITCFIGFSLCGWIVLLTSVPEILRKRRKDAMEQTSTEGRIVEYVLKETAGTKDRPYRSVHPVVEYTVYGRTYRQMNNNTMDGGEYPVGSTVTVLYDETMPEHFHLEEDALYRDGGKRMILLGTFWILGSAVVTLTMAILIGGWSPPDLRHLFH